MKTIDKIIESKEEPKDKNVLWVNGDKLLAMVKGKWTPVGGGSSDNVQGGGGESGGGSAFEYLDVTNVTGMNGRMKDLILQMTYMCKVPQTTKVDSITLGQGVAPASAYMGMLGRLGPGSSSYEQALSAITAISIDFGCIINMNGQVMTIQELFAMYGAQADIDAIPRITKEEFYNLEA